MAIRGITQSCKRRNTDKESNSALTNSRISHLKVCVGEPISEKHIEWFIWVLYKCDIYIEKEVHV